jgi:alkanesulfonate monooxygenase SsuD/methylene tetrahydromethanopterin reductase-like flavin-dependent oxidoreductase (luciferase family)
MVKCAVGVPNIGEYADARLLAGIARDVEAAGWDGFFIWDHYAYGDQPVTDPVVAITACAMTTERIRVGALVQQLGRRRPHKVAAEMTALDHLSGGRMVLGVGLGSYEGDFAPYGDDPNPVVRGRKTDEALEVIVGLWSGERFSYRGQHFTITDGIHVRRPVQRPRIPVWVAGTWPAKPAFRRAARWDGTFPTFRDVAEQENVPPTLLADAVNYVRAHREPEAGPIDVILEGRSPGNPPLAEYTDAGLTWWIEKLGWWRGDLASTMTRISAGPPTA